MHGADHAYGACSELIVAGPHEEPAVPPSGRGRAGRVGLVRSSRGVAHGWAGVIAGPVQVQIAITRVLNTQRFPVQCHMLCFRATKCGPVPER